VADSSSSLTDLFVGAVTLGERGQIVIPAEARDAYGLRAGDKLLVFHHPGHSGIMVVRVQDVQRIAEDFQKLLANVGELQSDPETAPPSQS
jgi:AbrB family looped-hinge helix DNA binding protein